MKVRQKMPTLIAEQFTADMNAGKLAPPAGVRHWNRIDFPYFVPTRAADVGLRPTDWVLTDPSGTVYVLSDQTFRANYEEIT